MTLPGFGLPDGGRRRVSVPWRARDVLIASGLVLALFVASLIAVSGIVRAAGESQEWFDNGEVAGLPAPLAFAAVLEAIFLIVVLRMLKISHWRGLRQLGFVRPDGRAPYALAALAWFAGLAASGLWIFLAERIGADILEPPDAATEVLGYSGGELIVPLIVVGLFGPFCEEVFFRGFALPGFAARYGVRGGIAASAALFAVFHFNIGLLVPVFIFGIVLGWLYARTGSIYPSIAAHSMQNVIALLLVN